MHRAICKERGLLTAEGKTIKHKKEILALLKALWKPKKVAIIHCPGHQKGNGPIPRGNNLVDGTTWEVTAQANLILAPVLVDPGPPLPRPAPSYLRLLNIPERTWLGSSASLRCSAWRDGWWRSADNKIILPEHLGQKLLPKIHCSFHMRTRGAQDLLRQPGVKVRDG